MKKFILFLCMCCGISLHAQQFKVDLSAQVKMKEDMTDFHRYGKHLYSDKTNWEKMQLVFTANLKKVNYGVELIQYDEQFKELKKVSLDNGQRNFGPFSPLVHYGEKAIYVIYFKFTDDDKVKMYVSKVNPDDLTVVATKVLMEYDQKNQGFFGTLKTIDDSQVFYTVSEDGKNAWIVHASPKLIQTCVIDSDLNLVQKTESIPVKLKDIAITGAHIGNDGNKVLVYKYDNPELKAFYARGVFFQPANAKGSFKDIKFKGGFTPRNLQLQLSKDGSKLYLGGEYFGAEYAFGGQGVLLGQVDMAKQVIATPMFYPYTDELKRRVFDLDFASKKKGELVFIDFNLNYQINEMENGTIVLSADMLTSNSSAKQTVFFYGPIIHVFIKPAGNVIMNLIPKKQAAGSVTSFFNYIFEDKLICIYGDLPIFQSKEFNDKSIGLARAVEGIVPVANIYSSDGLLLSRKMLFESAKKLKGNVMIGARSRIAENKFLFPLGETRVNMVKYYTSVNQFCYLEIL